MPKNKRIFSSLLTTIFQKDDLFLIWQISTVCLLNGKTSGEENIVFISVFEFQELKINQMRPELTFYIPAIAAIVV